MSLPNQIPPQSVPIGRNDASGNVIVDTDWYLFIYNLALNAIGRGGSSVPASPFDAIDMVELDAQGADLPQAYQGLANLRALIGQEIELPSPDLAQLRRALDNAYLLFSDLLLQDAPIHLASNQVYGILPVANGGTNANVAGPVAANNIGALAMASNLSDLANAATARANLGLGTIVSSSFSSVAMGGSIINLTSISVPAGTWDIDGGAIFTGSTANITNAAAGSSTTTAAFGPAGSYFQQQGPALTAIGQAVPTTRYTFGSTTTVFLPGFASFSTGTVSASGILQARLAK